MSLPLHLDDISENNPNFTLPISEGELEHEEIKLKCENSFYEFCKNAWPVLEPETPFQDNWHIEVICDHLMAVASGEIRNLLINMPPRCTKSLIVSVFWPAWTWINKPTVRWMFSSYSQSFSTRDSVKCRDLILSYWYQSFWKENYKFASDQNEKLMYKNSETGYRLATSVGGNATGEGASVLVADDANKASDAHSKAARDQVNTWWTETMSTRLNDPRKGSKVVIQQRVHERDLSGYILSEIGNYEHLNLPMEYKPRTYVTSIGFKDPRTQEGELLWPARFGTEDLKRLKRELGTRAFSSQMNQSPAPDTGDIFQRKWWKFYRELPEIDYKISSWDFAFKSTSKSDYVVGQIWGKSGANKYLIDQVRSRMSFTECLVAMVSLVAKHPGCNAHYVEAKANGDAVIDVLKSKIQGIIGFNPTESKEARASAVSPQVEAGNVFLPHPDIAPWVHDFIEETASFPNSANDDQTDCLSLGLKMLSNALDDWFASLEEEDPDQPMSEQVAGLFGWELN